jgi:hypothetical protein
MDKQLVFHIPNAATKTPMMDGYVVDQKVLEDGILLLTDWYTEDFFYSEEEDMIAANF